MPTNTFMQLKDQKRSEILEAACMELAEGSCNNLQVSRLAARMQISRSVFYSYFHSRRDLLCCLLYYLYDGVLSDFLDCLQAEDGDFQEASIKVVSQIKEDGKWKQYASLFWQFINEIKYQELVADTVKEYYESGKVREFVGACYEMLNPEKYGGLEQEKLEYALLLVMDIVLYAFLTNEADSKDEDWEALLYRIRVIGRGLQHLSSERRAVVYTKNQS